MSSDPLDIASDVEEAMRSAAIRDTQAKASKDRTLLPIGACYNCQSPVRGGEVYCDNDCRDDHRHRMNRGVV